MSFKDLIILSIKFSTTDFAKRGNNLYNVVFMHVLVTVNKLCYIRVGKKSLYLRNASFHLPMQVKDSIQLEQVYILPRYNQGITQVFLENAQPVQMSDFQIRDGLSRM